MFDRGSKEWMLLLLLIISSLISLIYLLWGAVLYPAFILKEENREKYNRSSFVIKGIVMLLCPLVGPCFFFFGEVFIHLLFRNEVDLEDVIFSKERVSIHMKADEEVGRNMAPLEEAIAVSDTASLRTLMLNVVRGDIRKSLSSIALALNSEDSETSHYAASVLRDELNDFRTNVQKIYGEIKEDEENCAEFAVMLISYMNSVLEQKVFSDIEQKPFVIMMEEVCSLLYEKDKSRMDSQYFEWICMRLLEIEEFDLSEKWCRLGMEEYPDELSSYTCRLKLYYTIPAKEKFFQAMEELKKTNIIIDSETLELIRIFS